MPGRQPASPRRRPRATASTDRAEPARRARALLVIDHKRLQGAAWAEFHTARKQLDRAARDLHRHEEIDSPAYEAWLHRTFPLLITALRELQDEVTTKARKVEAAQAMAAYTGRSPKRLWREQKEREAKPPRPADDPAFDDAFPPPRDEEEFAAFPSKPAAAPSPDAREIYRRLVQRLHPDRGGSWTAARQHLWHEVQQAWAARDTDWLSRLEVEWETAHEVIGPASPVSRLRHAIAELRAARRDIERKLQDYRHSLPWRFTRTEAKRALLLHRTELILKRDLAALRRELRHFDTVIAAWEDDWTQAGNRVKFARRRRPTY